LSRPGRNTNLIYIMPHIMRLVLGKDCSFVIIMASGVDVVGPDPAGSVPAGAHRHGCAIDRSSDKWLGLLDHMPSHSSAGKLSKAELLKP
jgi:hypothetical protein